MTSKTKKELRQLRIWLLPASKHEADVWGWRNDAGMMQAAQAQ